jgi:hypothetical protein
MRVAEKLDWKGLKIKKSVGNRENHNVGRGPTWDRRGLMTVHIAQNILHVHTFLIMNEPEYHSNVCGG